MYNKTPASNKRMDSLMMIGFIFFGYTSLVVR